MCDGLRRFVGLVLRVVFFWRAAWVLEGVGCMCDYVVLPLLNSSFEPGRAREVVEGFVDVDLRNIARAELFYFTGQAEECCEITRGYLSSRVIELKLSACILYGYSNLSLGNVAAAKRGMEGIQSCVKIAMKKKVPKDVYASCLLAGYVGAVLLHLPTDGMPAFGEYSRMLPEGLRLFATYVMAHHTYLNGEIWSAYGMGKAALFMAERSYPISMTYIHCMMAVCAINRKHKQEAQEEMLRSWELAKMDGFLEPFIEHHGLLRGLIEACIRKTGERLQGSCRRWSFLLPCWQVGDGPIRRSESIWGFPLILLSITLRISFAS